MKVVINACYGGFSLSLKGQIEYLRRKGKEAFCYKLVEFGKDSRYERIYDLKDTSLFTLIYLKDSGETFTTALSESWFYDREVDRNDPDLVAVVEELKEESCGICAKLKVVEIPDGINWVIEEYDGYESVEEKT